MIQLPLDHLYMPPTHVYPTDNTRDSDNNNHGDNNTSEKDRGRTFRAVYSLDIDYKELAGVL